MPTMHFRCLIEGTVVLLCKYVNFYFDLYRSENKQNLFLYWENFLSVFSFSSIIFFLLFLSCSCILLLLVSLVSCVPPVIVFCSTNWVNSSTWAEVHCILPLPENRRGFIMFLFSTSFHSGESLPPGLIAQTNIFLSSELNSSFILSKNSSCGL